MHVAAAAQRVFILILLSLISRNVKAQLTESLLSPGNRFIPHRLDTNAVNHTIEKGKEIAQRYPDSAVRLLRTALRQSELGGYQKGIRSSFGCLLPLLDNKGAYAEKEQLLREAWSFCAYTKGSEATLVLVCNALGKGFQQQEKYDLAARYYTLALRTAEKYTPKDLPGIYNNYGAMLLTLSTGTGTSDTQALYYIQKAEDLARQTGNTNALITALINKGNVFMFRLRYDESLFALQQAAALAQKHHFTQWHHLSLSNIGNLYYEQQRYAEAIPYLQKAMALNTEGIDPFYRNAVVVVLGKIYTAQKQYSKAEPLLLAALEQAKQLQMGRDLVEVHQWLARLYAARGQYQEAYRHHELYAGFRDSLTGKEIAGNVHRLEAKFRSAEKDKELLGKQLRINRQTQQLQQQNHHILLVTSGGLVLLVLLLIAVVLLGRYRQQKKLLLKDKKIEALKAMMNGEEKERIRMAQELHDGIGGMLGAINMNFSAAEQAGFDNKPALSRIMKMVEDTAGEVRKTAHNLMPAALLRHHLPEAIRAYCLQFQAGGALHIDVNIQGTLAHLDPVFSTALFRIIQELLQNIVRHAQADHAIIEIAQEQRFLHLVIEDNGIGFDTEERTTGFGLENLRFRVKTLGGMMTLESEKGSGTTVIIKFDLDHIALNPASLKT